MTLYWRKTFLNQCIKNVERPEDHPLDVYMVVQKLLAEECLASAKTVIQPFTVHNEHSLTNFLVSLNTKLGRDVYYSSNELAHLGIVLNIETGYMIHISSTTDTKNNFIFGLASNVNGVLENILKSCDFCGEPSADVKLVKKWIKLLYFSHGFELKMNRYRPSFHVEYRTEISKKNPALSFRHETGVVNLYVEPDPLIPIFKSFQCDYCLKSLAKIKHVMLHINENHKVPKGYKSNDFISPSYSQMTPGGFISVLVSKKFIKIENFVSPSLKKSLPPYFIIDSLRILKQQNPASLGYTINEISEFDEMFNFNYIIKFIDSLTLNDFNYYLDYCRLDDTYRQINDFLTKLLFNMIVCQTRTYAFETTLTTHRQRTLKFYVSSASHPAFVFGKISNLERILNYSKAVSKALLILFASFNLKRRKLKVFCEDPDYKIFFTSSQKKLLKSLLKYILANYKNKQIIMYKEEQIKDTTLKLELEEEEEVLFWNTLSGFFIDISLQKEGKHTPLQTVFCLSTCYYDFPIKKLNFHRPPKRSQIFKALLYIIRLSFLSSINCKTDEYYNALINEATIKGELRNVMEKIYYPTLYYFLKRKAAILQPFFNPDKYTYVHPVCFIDKLVGCKVLGLYSINIMLEKTIDYINTECFYIRRFSEIQCDFDDDNSMLRVLEDYKIDRHMRRNKTVYNCREDDPSYVEHMLTREFKKSISGITCLLIGYLVLTNRPLLRFSEYLNIPTDALDFSENEVSISTDTFTLTVSDKNIVRCFKYYQVIRVFLLKIDDKLDDDYFFLKLDYVKPKTFFDLMGSRYTNYRHLCSFLRACHDKNDAQGTEFSKEWTQLVRQSLRERSEGYLVVNLQLVAPDHQKFVGGDNIEYIDPRSYLSMDEKFSLKDIIESGFLDYQFVDEELHSETSETLDENVGKAMADYSSFDGIRKGKERENEEEEEQEEKEKEEEEEYENLIKRIKTGYEKWTKIAKI